MSAPGRLYLVATPIGNLGDITARALETLKGCDFIAAEDTRVTLKLLTHFGIKKPVVSYHEHNKEDAGAKIISKLLDGQSCALVTDAGTPAISDPGEHIAALCAEAGIPVTPVPGACAAICALSVSGLPTGRFCFEGFLTVNKRGRRERLRELLTERRTMIFYEGPHKLCATLADLHAALSRCVIINVYVVLVKNPLRKTAQGVDFCQKHEEKRGITSARGDQFWLKHYAGWFAVGGFDSQSHGRAPQLLCGLTDGGQRGFGQL